MKVYSIIESASHPKLSDLRESGALEQHCKLPLSPENSHVMLCGNSSMLNEATAILEAKGLQRHSRVKPGHVAIEKYF